MPDLTTEEINRNTVEKFLDMINREHRVREAFELHASEKYDNPQGQPGRDPAIAFIEEIVARPGFRPSVRRILADGDMVAVHMYLQFGEETSGLVVMDLWRLEDGKLIEHWDAIQQIDKIPN